MVNLRVCALECEALRGLLQERAAQCLVLDCRSFFSFNAAHIRGSCNVRLSTIVRRRAKGALALEHVVPNEELRARLRQGLVHTVVLLDERSADLELPKRDSTLLLALGTLCREARGARICFLKGEWPRDGAGPRQRGRGGAAGPAALPAGLRSPPGRAALTRRLSLPSAPAGGYEAFSSACSELCTKPVAPTGLSLPLSASSAPGSADSGCSSCGTPLYDQVSGDGRGAAGGSAGCVRDLGASRRCAKTRQPAAFVRGEEGRLFGNYRAKLTGCPPFLFQGGPVEILPFLYLGSAYHASRKDMLDALGITALINVSANCPNHFEGHYQYKSIPVEDNHKADISSWFNEAIDFIGK